MEAKKRTPSRELQVLTILSYRFNLKEKDKLYYLNLQKGYEGELMFDQMLAEQLNNEYLILKDLLLTINYTTFQIDTLIIFPSLIHFFEIKNFEGEYTFKEENYYKNPDYEITNPEDQMKKAKTLLRQLLKSHGFGKIPIESHVVFVNPEFTLYNAPNAKPIILPTQINSFLKKLNSYTGKIMNRDKIVAQKLISLHQNNSPFQKIPKYEYVQLRKGIVCQNCKSFLIKIAGHYCHCRECGNKEKLADAVKRSIKEFQLLFPEEKITTNTIYDWCGIVPSKQRIKRILERNFKLISKRRWSYYE